MSNQVYDIKWERKSNQPRPEDELDADSRRDALHQIFEELGVEDEVELKPVERRLGGDLPYFTIANLVFDSVETAVIVYQLIDEQGDRAVLSDTLKSKLDDRHKEVQYGSDDEP